MASNRHLAKSYLTPFIEEDFFPARSEVPQELSESEFADQNKLHFQNLQTFGARNFSALHS